MLYALDDYTDSSSSPGIPAFIPISACIEYVVVLLAIIFAFFGFYFLCERREKLHMKSAAGSTILSDSFALLVDDNKESLPPGYEALTHEDDTSSAIAYELIKNTGVSAMNTLYGGQIHNV